MRKDSLGDRMKKNYEDAYRFNLTRRTPVIIRLDGKAFHTFTRGCVKPFDDAIIKAMQQTTEYLVNNIQGCKVGYVQSDEISLLLTDFDTFETDAWFSNNIQKMCSISASMASVQFTGCYHWEKMCEDNNKGNWMLLKPAHFDSRVFNIPKEEVVNYFRWRYMDWKRNSVSMLAQSLFSQKELNGKNTEMMKAMCIEKGKVYEALAPVYKNGTMFVAGSKFEDFDLLHPSFVEWFNKLMEPKEC
jgi:tRNA(His) 5'-end guanylyltransferase